MHDCNDVQHAAFDAVDDRVREALHTDLAHVTIEAAEPLRCSAHLLKGLFGNGHEPFPQLVINAGLVLDGVVILDLGMPAPEVAHAACFSLRMLASSS